MGGAASRYVAPIKYRRVEKDLENKVADALKERAKSSRKTFSSVNSITTGLPRSKEGLRNIRDVFDQGGKVPVLTCDSAAVKTTHLHSHSMQFTRKGEKT